MANVSNPESSLDDPSSKTPVKMEPPQEESLQQQPVAQTTRVFCLRKRRYKAINLKKVRTVQAMCKLLCKPVQINVTRLSMEGLKPPSETTLHRTQKRSKMIQKAKWKAQKNKVQRNKVNNNQNQVPEQIKKRTRHKTSPISNETRTADNSLDKENLFKEVKQPYIKLNRVEEVIHKIAQSFAKKMPKKECGSSVNITHLEEVNTDKCLQTDNSQVSTFESHDPLQLDDSIQNDSDNSDLVAINRNISRKNNRKRKIIYRFDDSYRLYIGDSYDIENDNDNLPKLYPKKIKILKLSIPGNNLETRAAVTGYNTIVTRHSNVSDKSNSQGTPNATEEAFRIPSFNYATKRTKRQRNFPPVPSNSTCIAERKAPRKFRYGGWSVSNNQPRIDEFFVSDKSLKAKYNLLKELKVCLIELNHIKDNTGNKYSAREIEKLTRKYIEFWKSPELMNQELIDKEMKIEENDEKLDIEYAPIYNSNVYEYLEYQGQQQVNNWEVPHRLSESDTVNLSGKMSFNNSALSSPVKSLAKTSVIENVIRTKQLKGRLNSFINKVQSPNKEQSEMGSPKKSSSNMRILDRNIFSKKSIAAHNEKLLISGRKTFVTKIHAKTVNIINPKVNTKKNITSCHSTVLSSGKHKKSMDKKDSAKGVRYKCIVCDLCFENYSNLQHHLSTHTQKQNNVPSSPSKECASTSEASKSVQEEVPGLAEPKEPEPPVSEQESELATSVSSSSAASTQQNNNNTQQQTTVVESSEVNKKNYFSKQRTNFINMLCKPSECSICSKSFPTAADLAAHIFLHTERELQTAFEQAKLKNNSKAEEAADTSKNVQTSQSDDTRNTKSATKSSVAVKQQKSPVMSKVQDSRVTHSTKIRIAPKPLLSAIIIATTSTSSSTVPTPPVTTPPVTTSTVTTPPVTTSTVTTPPVTTTSMTTPPVTTTSMTTMSMMMPPVTTTSMTTPPVTTTSMTTMSMMMPPVTTTSMTTTMSMMMPPVTTTSMTTPPVTTTSMTTMSMMMPPVTTTSMTTPPVTTTSMTTMSMMMPPATTTSMTTTSMMTTSMTTAKTSTSAVVTTTTATIPLNALIILDISKTITVPITNTNIEQRIQPLLAPKLGKKKLKKCYRICSCHSGPGVSDKYLRIEIVLLCHTCKILFRSIDCFDAHYDLSEHVPCSRNRVGRNRTPHLLCVTCSVMFKSIQDMRHHLENHDRRLNCTMDFRCTVCKVIFIGIGPLFYHHWSKHMQDPCWKADDTTFPSNMVLNQVGQTSDEPTDSYIRIAEYICQKCKIPFITEDDLKKHTSTCKSLGSIVSVAGSSSSTNTEKPLEIEVNCSLCNDVFTEKRTFYKHVRNKHNFISEPQFVSVSLTLINTAYICNICMEISESVDDFEDHWLKHSTATVYFTCTYCTKSYCNGLNAFLEHARTHEVNVKQYILSCTVDYADVAFVCKHCTIGFQTEKIFNEHNVIHKQNKALNCKNNNAKNQETAVPDSEITILVHDLEEPKEASQSTQQKDGADPKESEKDKGKERLINILEGNEDDSEHELIIDWVERPEEESQSEERNKEKQANSAVVASTKNEVQSSPQNCTVSVSFKNLIPSSQTSTEFPQTYTSTVQSPLISLDDTTPQQPGCSDVQNVGNNTSGLTNVAEEPTLPKKSSPAKPRHGFLRVKTLAELTNKTKPVQAEPSQQSPTYFALNQQDKQDGPNFISFQNFLISGKQVVPATISATTNQQLNPTQITVTQPKPCTGFAQASSPAYHKNLPACNILRKTSIVSRFAPRSENAPAKIASSSNLQSQQTVYSTPTFTNASFVPLNNRKNSSRLVLSPRPIVPALSTGGPAANTALNNSQQPKQREDTPQNVTYHCPYLVTTSTSRSNDVLQKGQTMVINPPMTRDASTMYYKDSNSSTGGMSIVINQTTPAVQNMPTINIVGQEQQPVYQPQVYTEPALILDQPYMRQPQNVTDFSVSSNVYQIVTSEYQILNRESTATYKLNLQSVIFLCSYCPEDMSFSSTEQLEMHLDLAHNFVCNTCGQRSYTLNESSVHKTKHDFI